MHQIVDRTFLIRFQRRAELDRLRVDLPERNRVLSDFPINPAVEVFNYDNLNRLRFVVAQGDLK